MNSQPQTRSTRGPPYFENWSSHSHFYTLSNLKYWIFREAERLFPLSIPAETSFPISAELSVNLAPAPKTLRWVPISPQLRDPNASASINQLHPAHSRNLPREYPPGSTEWTRTSLETFYTHVCKSPDKENFRALWSGTWWMRARVINQTVNAFSRSKNREQHKPQQLVLSVEEWTVPKEFWMTEDIYTQWKFGWNGRSIFENTCELIATNTVILWFTYKFTLVMPTRLTRRDRSEISCKYWLYVIVWQSCLISNLIIQNYCWVRILIKTMPSRFHLKYTPITTEPRKYTRIFINIIY